MNVKKTAIVTGGFGFIGLNLIKRLLAADFDVRCIDIDLGHDILNWKKQEDHFHEVDYFFHLAALTDIVPSVTHPDDYMETNVLGTVRMLEIARHFKVKKFVYAASGSCYGDNPPLPTSEDAPLNPKYPYALSKMMGEEACMHWHRVYGLPVNSLRLFNVYGPGQFKSNYGAVFSTFLAQRANNQPLTIIGDGSQSRDFVHVDDVCRAFILAAETELSGQIWNVGSGWPITVDTLAQLIGGDVEYIPDRPGEPKSTKANIAAIRRDLGWHPKKDFAHGVAELMCDIERYKDRKAWTADEIAEVSQPWFDALSKDR